MCEAIFTCPKCGEEISLLHESKQNRLKREAAEQEVSKCCQRGPEFPCPSEGNEVFPEVGRRG